MCQERKLTCFLVLLLAFRGHLLLTTTETSTDAFESDERPLTEEGDPVNFYIYDLALAPAQWVPLSNVNATVLLRSARFNSKAFNSSRPTVMVTHGHGGSLQDMSIVTIRKAYASRGVEYNVIAVEWSKYAALFYPLSVMYVNEVGASVAKMVDRLVRLGNEPDSISLIGHSLGAHVMGSAGRQARRKVGRIVGLDPAGPLVVPAMKLSRSDARLVEVVHTCGSLFGLAEAVGHVDFYPNGGLRQVGCENEYPRCDHLRAYHLYAEALLRQDLLGVRCGSYDDFLKNNCKKTGTLALGFVRKQASLASIQGQYYFRTNGLRPFGMGYRGIKP